MVREYTAPLPRALPEAATLGQITTVVNENTARVQSFSANRASISTPRFPSLRANIAYQKDRQFRLRGDTVITGPEVDLGSNNELFWLWIRRNQPPGMFFCRHDQFAASPARRMIPIEPNWIVEALGLVTFAPQDRHQGPFPVGNGRVEVRTTRPGDPDGLTRVTVVDDSRGILLQQSIYDGRGVLLATAQLSRHMRDIASGAITPRHVDIQWPSAKFELSIELGEVSINQLEGDPLVLFSKPDYPGYPNVDLATMAPAMNPAAAMPQQTVAPPPTGTSAGRPSFAPGPGATPQIAPLPATLDSGVSFPELPSARRYPAAPPARF